MTYPPVPGAGDDEPSNPYGTPPRDGDVPPQTGGYPGSAQYPGATPYPGATAYPGAGPYPGGPAGYGGYYPKNSLAVWSLVLGIVSMLVCGLFTGIPAVILGHNAKRAVAEGQADNPGMATAGIVLGWVAIALSVLAVFAMLAFFPAFLTTLEMSNDFS
ncbi:DUF4190 domain-containing protein [Oerskovia flava]|uniref:DUF4190 domain-containing protein n=1 Tax=Oerskovia flava TaxID=2986422 RepID=UPI00223EC7C6|nr:DUF4190 domain-containing protein [Oerskovia sp. JB1-3-2]